MVAKLAPLAFLCLFIGKTEGPKVSWSFTWRILNREVFECNLLLYLQLRRRRTRKLKLVFKERREFRKASVSPVVGSPVYEWCRHTILASLAVAIGAPKRWWRTRSDAEGVGDAARRARREGAIFFDSLTAGSRSSRWHSLIIVPGNQTFIEQKPARWKPFLSVGSLKTTLSGAFLWFIVSIFVMTPPAAESMLQRCPTRHGRREGIPKE